MKLKLLKLSVTSLFLLSALFYWQQSTRGTSASAQTTPNGPTSSGPIAVAPNDQFVWVANPDTDSVSVLNVANDANQKVAEIPVGDEPNAVAIHPNGQSVYVANTISGTVSVINTTSRQVTRSIPVGTEPYGMALTPNGTKLYVANARSDDLSVIDTATNTVTRVIQLRAPVPCPGCPPCPTCPLFEPRGVAITSDGDADDTDEKVYVTQFNAVDRPNIIIGADDYKEGRVLVITTNNDAVVRTVVLAPQDDVGFNSNGSALKRIAPTNPATFTVKTGAFPNSLNAVAIKGNRAYLPNNAASADGPVRFNVNVQAFLNVIDTTTDTEAKVGNQLQSINMNRGINFEPASEKKLFLGMPWHIAFEPKSNEGWVVAMAANIIVKVTLDADGTPTINAPKATGETGNIVRIEAGQKPIGIAINAAGTRAYVANEVSRDVTVINLETEKAVGNVSTAALPAAGTTEATVHYGKAIFFSSGKVNVPTGPAIPVGRLSSEGWSGCVSCHAFGLTDQVVWIFGAGPRRSVPLHATFNPRNPADQKILNYSAIFDEVQDFENNMRGVSGGLGLITTNGQPDGPQDPTLNAFALANTGRSQSLDALATFVARGIRSPISPLRQVPPTSPLGREIALGRKVFIAAGCATCHSGGGWSLARRDYTPPPNPADIVNGQVIRFLRQVNTFNSGNVNEIRQNGAAPLGADGYAPPSLLGAWALGPLLHNGSALTIEQVLDNPTHRRAGKFTFDPDPINNQQLRAALVLFLKSIDAATPPIQGPPLR